MKYEYNILVLRGAAKDEREQLNAYGKEGWEIISIVPFAYERVVYFKRPI